MTESPIVIEAATVLDRLTLGHLVEESGAQGLDFLERLVREYESGENLFQRPGEVFFVAREESGGRLVGTGGLNIDPFSADPRIGRLRRLYVSPGWRGRGIGVRLIRTIVGQARAHFRVLQLRSTPSARRLYESLGFQPVLGDPQVTHRMPLE